MKQKTMILLALSLLMVLALAVPVLAQHAQPEPDELAGYCPPSFDHWHNINHNHSGGEHLNHKHVGSEKDHNEDGWLCAKHVAGNSVHIHVDNSIPKFD